MSAIFTASRRPWLRRLRLSIEIALLMFLLSGVTVGQATSKTDGSTPLGLSPGAPAGSYALSGFESINPYNGNLNLHLPLAGLQGRGGLGARSESLDSQAWLWSWRTCWPPVRT